MHRQAHPGATAEGGNLGEAEAEDFREDPAADGELRPPQAEQQERADEAQHRAAERRGGQGEEDRPAGKGDEGKQRIAAETDEGLLADRDDARIAGQQVPQRGEGESDRELHPRLQRRIACEERVGEAEQEEQAEAQLAPPAPHQAAIRGNRP